jgi:heme-degrading monooxygenase HmoA
MISRTWRGLAKSSCAQAYVDHLQGEQFPALKDIPGFLGASILKRVMPRGVEFLVISNWASYEAIHAFAGAKADSAVVPQKVHDMMVEYDRTTVHYDIVP